MSQPSESLNQVVLVGRVSAAPESRELPSGDTVVNFRVVVDRPPARAARAARADKVTSRRQVDVIDVACWSRRTQRSAGGLATDAEVRVEGSLRRRFFSVAGSRASRYEVEAERITRVSVARAAKASSGG